MKRLLAIVLTVCTVLSICSCKQQPQQDTTASTSADSQTNTDNIIENLPVDQKPMYAISLPPVHDATENENKNVVFHYTYQNISLILPEPEVADKIIVDFLNRTDTVAKAAADMRESAQDAYPIYGQTWMLQSLYAPMRFDTGVLSLFGEKVSYTGSAHSLNFGQAVTYDLLTGNPLRLMEILNHNVSASTLCSLVIESLTEIKDKVNLKSSYQQIVTQIFNDGLASCERWYFSQKGLCFYFDIYEIAPYTSGCITAEIPYSKLVGIVKDAYFPSEYDSINGTVSAVKFTEKILDNFTQFAEIILDQNSSKILFYTDRAVSNIRIQSAGSSISPNNAPGSGNVVFAAHTLTPGDAIMLEVDPKNHLLQLSYQSGSETVCFNVSINADKIDLSKL